MSKKDQPNDETYLQRAKQEIQVWETGKPGYIAQVGDFILSPAMNTAAKLVPESIQNAVTEAVEKTLRLMSEVGKLTVNSGTIVKDRKIQLEAKGESTWEKQLEFSDHLSRDYWNWHIGYAAVEGGGTGALGLLGLAADIPMILSIVIREIRTIGASYGYDTNSPEETDYILRILSVGSAGDIKVKIEFLLGLKEIEQILLKVAWKQMAQGVGTKGSILAVLREFAKTLGIQLTKRKALQMVPIVGALIGSSFNAVYANDIGRAAYMCYRRRFILEHESDGKMVNSPPVE
jgi:hypothetical protein